MRLGLRLRAGDIASAVRADELGIWAVEVADHDEPGSAILDAAAIAAVTNHPRIVVPVRLDEDHPFALAEEIAVLDNLSQGRVVVRVVADPHSTSGSFVDALRGRVVNGNLIAPPPVQARILVMPGDEVDIARIDLTGDLEQDGALIDELLVGGCTHAVAAWPGPIEVFARHLVTRSAMVDYPPVVSAIADRIAPFAADRSAPGSEGR